MANKKALVKVGKVDLSHGGAEELSQDMLAQWEDGNLSYISILAHIKVLQEALEKAEKEVRQKAIDECKVTFRDEIINDKKFEYAGVGYKVNEKSEVNYNDDPTYSELESKLKEVESAEKAFIEETLQQTDFPAEKIAAKRAIEERKDIINGYGLLPRTYTERITVYLPK